MDGSKLSRPSFCSIQAARYNSTGWMAQRGPLVAAAKRFFSPAIILIAAAIAASSVLLHGPFCGDDFQFHLISWLDAQQNWRAGISYPHWTPSPNFGAGEPRFMFYPPLTWMLGAALGLVLPWAWVPVTLIFILLSATGFATRALGRRLLSTGPATAAAIAAIFCPYALFTSYGRAAFAELAGGFWMPLLLLFVLRDRSPSATVWRRALDGSTLQLALVLAGAWLSNAPVGVMASYLLACVALGFAILARSWFPVIRAAVALTLGLALTAAYLLPAAYEQRWVDILEATGVTNEPGFLIENHWLFVLKPHFGLNYNNDDHPFVSIVVLSMLVMGLFGAVVFWRRRATMDVASRRIWLIFACIPVVILILQLPPSLPLWNHLPKLRFLQFPWRWLVVLEAPMAIMLAAALWPRSVSQRWKFCVVAVAVLVTSMFYATRTFFRPCASGADLPTLLARHSSGKGFWGAYEYAPPGTDNSLVPTGLPDLCLTAKSDVDLGIAPNPNADPIWRQVQGSCIATAAATLRTPEHLRVSMTAAQAGFAVLRLRTFPAWKISLNGKPVATLQTREDGLVAIPVAPGLAIITADWSTTPDVTIGRYVTLLAFVALAILWFVERRIFRASE